MYVISSLNPNYPTESSFQLRQAVEQASPKKSSFASRFSLSWDKVLLVCDTVLILAGIAHFFFLKLPLYSFGLALYGIGRLIVHNLVLSDQKKLRQLAKTIENKDSIIKEQEERLKDRLKDPEYQAMLKKKDKDNIALDKENQALKRHREKRKRQIQEHDQTLKKQVLRIARKQREIAELNARISALNTRLPG